MRKRRSDARPILLTCEICARTREVKPSKARQMRTCGDPSCTAEIRRQNATAQAGSIRARWERKVQKTPDCWYWRGAKDQDGYGYIVANGKHLLAHRLSHELHVGPIPEGVMVCHHCDTPPCVNPAHLYAGTASENTRDMRERGRTAPKQTRPPRRTGAENGRSRYTEEQVRAIRRLHRDGKSQTEIAEAFGMLLSTVHKIVHRQTWRDLDDTKTTGD